MTDEKKKPEEDELSEEKLEEVAGGGGGLDMPGDGSTGPGPRPRLPVFKEEPPTKAFESMDREGTIE
jgi:hypothetical protein